MILIDLIFPPLCLSCKERCRTKVLCPDCWLLCTPPDPIERCRLCFEELDCKGKTCTRCKRQPLLPIVRAYVFDPESPARCLSVDATEALAGFALYQWIQLDWPLPDAILSMPDSIPIARAFAYLLDRPFIKDRSILEEDLELLLIDISNPLEWIRKEAYQLRDAFPKRIYLLTLFG